MRRSVPFVGAAAMAAALLGGCSGKTTDAAPAAGSVSAFPPAEVVPEDPAEARRQAEIEEARGRFRSLQEAFAHGGRVSPASKARLETALRAASARTRIAWQVACRGRLCKVTARGPVEAWHAVAEQGEAVREVVDRIASDPDGLDPTLYALLAEEGAAPGDALLAQLESALRASAEARDCAAKARVSGTVEYELRVDGSGFTYRTGGDLPWPVISCLNAVLADLMLHIPVPPDAKTAARSVALRL
ncbi:MAG TPA: hypothetical protein VIW03_07715 [Anaeromyxobacter sp.]